MSKHIGIPIKVLHDAEGHTVTIELKNGETYRGKLDEAEDNMNCHLSNCTKTGRDGRVTTLANCFLRGSHVRFMVLPDILKNAPFFKKIDTKANKSAKSAESAEDAYDAAQKVAEKDLAVTHPIRLGLALNFSVFQYEVLQKPEDRADRKSVV